LPASQYAKPAVTFLPSGAQASVLKRFGKNLAMPPTDRRDDAPEGDVLSALPRTRPQRRSARRATPPKAEPAQVAAAADAVAASAGATAQAKPRPKRAAAKPKPAAAKPKPAAAKPRARAAAGGARPAPQPTAPAAPEVPPAGYATGPGQDGGDGGGRPGTGELVTTALQAVGEIAQLGAAVGQQAVRSALRRIPRP
jgi:hypothetical protein